MRMTVMDRVDASRRVIADPGVLAEKFWESPFGKKCAGSSIALVDVALVRFMTEGLGASWDHPGDLREVRQQVLLTWPGSAS